MLKKPADVISNGGILTHGPLVRELAKALTADRLALVERLREIAEQIAVDYHTTTPGAAVRIAAERLSVEIRAAAEGER